MTQVDTDTLAGLLAECTPGPWVTSETTIHGVKYGGLWVQGADQPDEDGLMKPPLICISGSGGSRSFTTRIVERQDHDDNDANARLIALAPELAAETIALRAQAAKDKAELTEARRRRDEWRKKAEGYDAVCLALREKVGDPWPPHLSRVMWAGLAAAEKKRADDAEARIERLEAALREAEETMKLVERPAFPDPAYHQGVKSIGLRIGFGALMSTASAAWRETLEETGYPTGGEFVAGPSFDTVVSCLAKIRAALEDGE